MEILTCARYALKLRTPVETRAGYLGALPASLQRERMYTTGTHVYTYMYVCCIVHKYALELEEMEY